MSEVKDSGENKKAADNKQNLDAKKATEARQAEALKQLKAVLGTHPAFPELFKYPSFQGGAETPRGKLSPSDMKAIAEYINQVENIRFCNFRNCELDDDAIIAFVTHLHSTSKIEQLFLSMNNIGARGAAALAKWMTVNSPLELSLSQNPIGDEGAIALAEVVNAHTKLKSLDLNNCNIKAGGMMALATMLSNNTSLDYVHLFQSFDSSRGDEPLPVEIYENILQALENNNQIKMFTFSFMGNDIFNTRLENILQRNKERENNLYRTAVASCQLFEQTQESLLKGVSRPKMENKNASEVKLTQEQMQDLGDLEKGYRRILDDCQRLQATNYYPEHGKGIPGFLGPNAIEERVKLAYYGSVKNESSYASRIQALEAKNGKSPSLIEREGDNQKFILSLLAIFHLEIAKELAQKDPLGMGTEVARQHLISAYVAGRIAGTNTETTPQIQEVTKQALLLWLGDTDPSLMNKSLADLLEMLTLEKGAARHLQLQNLAIKECERLGKDPFMFKLDNQTLLVFKQYPRVTVVYTNKDEVSIVASKDRPLDEVELKEIWKGVNATDTCRVLRLRQCQLNDERVQLIASDLAKNSCLTVLDLGNENYSQNPVLEKDYNVIGPSGVKTILQAIQGKKKLHTLSFANNSLGNEGAMTVAGDLRRNTCLVGLNLAGSHMGDPGIVELAEALKENRTLQSLDLRQLVYTDQGILAIADMLTLNSTLSSLLLEGHAFDRKVGYVQVFPTYSVEAIETLVKALEQNTSITKFDLLLGSHCTPNALLNPNDEWKYPVVEGFEKRIQAVLVRNSALAHTKNIILAEIESLKPQIPSKKSTLGGGKTVESKETKKEGEKQPAQAVSIEIELKKKHEAILQRCQELRSRDYPENRVRELVLAADLAYYSREDSGLSFKERIDALEARVKTAALNRFQILPELLAELGQLHFTMATQLKAAAGARDLSTQEQKVYDHHLMLAFVCGSSSGRLDSDFVQNYTSQALDFIVNEDNITGESVENSLRQVRVQLRDYLDKKALAERVEPKVEAKDLDALIDHPAKVFVDAYFATCESLNLNPRYFVQEMQGQALGLETKVEALDAGEGDSTSPSSRMMFSSNGSSAGLGLLPQAGTGGAGAGAKGADKEADKPAAGNASAGNASSKPQPPKGK